MEDLIFEAKAPNRRVYVYYFAQEDVYIIVTKRLIDRKKRLITETKNKFSPETFAILADLIQMVMLSPQFRTSTNRAWGRIEKQGRVKIGTNQKALTNQ